MGNYILFPRVFYKSLSREEQHCIRFWGIELDFEQTMLLKFEGEEAELGLLDFYDANQALVGFQRSLALTTHLILNGRIITQAPALKGAKIAVHPPQKGSWEILATIIGGVGYLGSRPKDTPLGHIVHSVYDYVLQRTMGVKVDYDKSVGELLEENKIQQAKQLNQGHLDDLAEKCEVAIKEMHRPIINSETATRGRFGASRNGKVISLKTSLSIKTFEALDFERRSAKLTSFEGMISSFNLNSRTGRIFVKPLARTVPFKLTEDASSARNLTRLVSNMTKLASGVFAENQSVRKSVQKWTNQVSASFFPNFRSRPARMRSRRAFSLIKPSASF